MKLWVVCWDLPWP